MRLADDAFHIGKAAPEESYLKHERILEIAIRCQADSIHPGYGFLAENDVFAEACLSKGINFIGPRPESIREMGSKSRAKQLMQEAGVPVVPGYHGDNQDYKTLRNAAEKIGFPLLIKPVAGIAMGLAQNETGQTAVLTDIQGVEDHLGDMDFKVAGTTDGITALQLDIKVEGITFDILA